MNITTLLVGHEISRALAETEDKRQRDILNRRLAESPLLRQQWEWLDKTIDELKERWVVTRDERVAKRFQLRHAAAEADRDSCRATERRRIWQSKSVVRRTAAGLDYLLDWNPVADMYVSRELRKEVNAAFLAEQDKRREDYMAELAGVRTDYSLYFPEVYIDAAISEKGCTFPLLRSFDDLIETEKPSAEEWIELTTFKFEMVSLEQRQVV